MHSVCTERESFVYLLSLMLTLAAVRTSAPFLERPWSACRSVKVTSRYFLSYCLSARASQLQNWQERCYLSLCALLTHVGNNGNATAVTWVLGKWKRVIPHPVNSQDWSKNIHLPLKAKGIWCLCMSDIFSERSLQALVPKQHSVVKSRPECQLHKNITTAHRHPFSTTMSIALGLSLTLTMCFSKRGPCELWCMLVGLYVVSVQK